MLRNTIHTTTQQTHMQMHMRDVNPLSDLTTHWSFVCVCLWDYFFVFLFHVTALDEWSRQNMDQVKAIRSDFDRCDWLPANGGRLLDSRGSIKASTVGMIKGAIVTIWLNDAREWPYTAYG